PAPPRLNEGSSRRICSISSRVSCIARCTSSRSFAASVPVPLPPPPCPCPARPVSPGVFELCVPRLGVPLLGVPLLGVPLLGVPFLGVPLLGVRLLGVPASSFIWLFS